MNYKNFSELDTNSVSINNNYTSFYDFGDSINNQVQSPFNSSNPLTYCLFPTMGNQFQHGSSTSNLLSTTYNPSCEYFMAERCSKSWDGFCEAYKVLNVDNYWPNVGVVDGTAYSVAQEFLRFNRPTVGDILIRNAVAFKFLHYPFLNYSTEPFDPNTANSPLIKVYPNYTSSPSIIKKINNIDKDEHVSLMLENPVVCFDVLARLYLSVLRKEPLSKQFQNTRIQKYFESNKEQLDLFVNQALKLIPSFNLTPSSMHQYATCTKEMNNL